jgi:small-conductance mechanosensitive channel
MKSSWLAEAKPHLRRATVYAFIAMAGLVVASIDEFFEGTDVTLAQDIREGLSFIGAVIFAVAGIAAVRAAARGARVLSSQRVGDTRGTALGLLIQVFGYFVVALTFLTLLSVDVSGLLLGGAITGVVLGIAAQQTLANFFAGLVLVTVRPLEVGERVVLRSGPLAGEYEGVVTDLGMFYVDMVTAQGPVKLPNAGVLAAAIGPGARVAKEEPEEEEPSEGRHGRQAPPSEGGA